MEEIMPKDKEKPKVPNVIDIYALTDTNSSFSQRFVAAVRLRGITFSEVHEKLYEVGIRRAYETVLGWSNDKRGIYLTDAIAVANILNVSPDWLLLGRSKYAPYDSTSKDILHMPVHMSVKDILALIAPDVEALIVNTTTNKSFKMLMESIPDLLEAIPNVVVTSIQKNEESANWGIVIKIETTSM
jgi:hypothetical protein